jgi:hypothetical protein
MPCGEPQTLPPEQEGGRLVPHDHESLEFDHDAGQWVPKPKAMQFDEDGLSLYWTEHVQGVHDQSLSAILRSGYPLLFRVSLDYALELGFPVAHDPRGAVLPDCAHVAVRYPPDLKTPAVRKAARARLIERMTLALGEITLVPQPGG